MTHYEIIALIVAILPSLFALVGVIFVAGRMTGKLDGVVEALKELAAEFRVSHEKVENHEVRISILEKTQKR